MYKFLTEDIVYCLLTVCFLDCIFHMCFAPTQPNDVCFGLDGDTLHLQGRDIGIALTYMAKWCIPYGDYYTHTSFCIIICFSLHNSYVDFFAKRSMLMVNHIGGYTYLPCVSDTK